MREVLCKIRPVVFLFLSRRATRLSSGAKTPEDLRIQQSHKLRKEVLRQPGNAKFLPTLFSLQNDLNG